MDGPETWQKNVALIITGPKDFLSFGLGFRLYFECMYSVVPKRATGLVATDRDPKVL